MTRRSDFSVGSRAAANAAASGGAVTVKAVAELSPKGAADPTAPETVRPPRRLRSVRGDIEFQPAALLIVDEPPSPVKKSVVCILAALLLTTFAWSYFGRIASYATAPGKVQAVGRTKVLEAQQSGQVIGIEVHDGDRVKAGDVMIRLDPADAMAARTIIVDQRADLRGQTSRDRAEIDAARTDPILLNPSVTWDDDVAQPIRDRESGVMREDLAQLAGTLSTLASRRAAAVVEVGKLTNTIAAQKALVAVTAENSSMADQLLQSGWNSRAKSLDITEALRAQQVSMTSLEGSLADAQASVATLDSQIAKVREGFVSDTTDALVAGERQIADLDQKVIKADKTLSQTTLFASVSGIVHASAVTTIGQFVRPSQQLMQIVPEHGLVEIIAYVQNSDVGLVRVGQDATIKVDSFNYATYGSIDGDVAQVGSDALPTNGKDTLQSASLDGDYRESTLAQRTSTLKYPVTIRAKSSTIMIDGQPMALTPGMSVSVEIETENRRLIEYVTSPILEMLSTAAHER